jgi:hypothetical protein
MEQQITAAKQLQSLLLRQQMGQQEQQQEKQQQAAAAVSTLCGSWCCVRSSTPTMHACTPSPAGRKGGRGLAGA